MDNTNKSKTKMCMTGIKLTSNAGKVPSMPKELRLRIARLKNPEFDDVMNEVDNYLQSFKTSYTPSNMYRLTI